MSDGQAAKKMENDPAAEAASRLARALEERSERLAALVRITTAVASSDDLGNVLQVVAFETARFIRFDVLGLALVDRKKGVYRLGPSVGAGTQAAPPAEPSSPPEFPLVGSAVEWAVAHRQPLVRVTLPPLAATLSPKGDRPPDDGQQSAPDQTFPEEERLAAQGMHSCALMPIVGREGVSGALLLASRSEQSCSKDDLNFLELVAEQVTGALERHAYQAQLRKRHGKLAIIHEISRKAMAQFDMVDVLDSVAGSIEHYFGYYDVSIFLVDDSAGDVVLMAQAGAYRERTAVGYRQKLGVGLVGICAATGETILANDVAREPRRVIAFQGEAPSGSELCVPIKAGDNVMGVINVESKEVGAFEDEDANTLEAFAAQIAQTIENARLYEETRLLKEFNENIIANMPTALAVVDMDMRVQIVNDTFTRLRCKGRGDLLHKDIAELFTPWFLREGGLAEAIRSAVDTGRPVSIPNVKAVVLPAIGRLFNVYVSSIGMGTQQAAMIMLEDVTQTVEHAYHLSMLRQINETVQTTLDLKRLLRLVLTCSTSGHALGFNRAILMMVNKNTNTLEGRLAIGPQSQEDAYRIWQRINVEHKSFKELLRDADDGRPDEEMPLYHLAARLKLPLDSDELVVRVVREKGVAMVADAFNDDRVSEEFRSIVGANSFVVVPLIAKDEAVGAIIADNLYSGQPITPEKVELLTIFANHVGLAIENAEAYDALHKQIGKLQEAYRELRETQGKLVQTEKLAAIGEVAAHVAHEIRNPLVTIGGFARSIRRQLGDEHPTIRSVDIIVEEVARLEKILANVMDFSKPSAPWKRPTKINQVIQNTCVLLSNQFESRQIELVQSLDPNVPLVMVDGEQIKQALLNILKNAAESIENEGRVIVTSRAERGNVWIDVSDTGKGVPEDMIPNLFDPFFTTRPDGTGLGLAVTRKIIVDHGGDIDVKSKLGVGTTFTISLPVEPSGNSHRAGGSERGVSSAAQSPAESPVGASKQGGVK